MVVQLLYGRSVIMGVAKMTQDAITILVSYPDPLHSSRWITSLLLHVAVM